MFEKLKQYSVIVILVQVLVIGFLIYLNKTEKRVYLLELKSLKFSSQSSLDSLKAQNYLSNSLVLAQSSALSLSSGQALTTYELEKLNQKISDLDSANLDGDYQKALRSVKEYLSQRQSSKNK